MPERTLLVDARAPFGSGLGRYVREIVRALVAQRAFPEIVLAGDPLVLAPYLRELDAPLRVLPLKVGRYSWRVPFLWTEIGRAVDAPHVTWFPHWDGAWSGAPMLTTLHDLIALDGTGPRALVRRAIARPWIARMVGASGALLTASEASAAEILERFPDAASKLHVVPHGVAEIFFSAGARSRGSFTSDALSAGSSRARAPYLLTVANKKAHKRLETAIRAFARLAVEDPTLRLVMVGERFDHMRTLRALADSLGVAARVDDETGLTDGQLADRYVGAEALLVPSRDEGFGLVALEAMACGTPVVAVDRATLREVVGDAGLFVPFDDADAMADAARRLRADPALRRAQIEAGLARAAQFTWARAATRTAALLHAL